MGRKPKFRPRIMRVKLNPEQAVLTCDCYNDGYIATFVGEGSGSMTSGGAGAAPYCVGGRSIGNFGLAEPYDYRDWGSTASS